MTWIKTILYDDAEGPLKTVYDRIKGPDNHIDNILLAHSLRPHTLEGHMALYKNVLHHPRNKLPKWLLESVGVYVSLINCCDYCVSHHYEGLRTLLRDDERAKKMRQALESGMPAHAYTTKEAAALDYAAILTREPGKITEQTIDIIRQAGLEDGEILEVNQVTSYFCYANRTVLGLGINKEKSMLGLSPSTGEADDWSHG
ncbi:MAG: alkylhydroperoxidase [Alphaproteobacteria bacterium]|nr:MAG: alkylhydroperoxidase [Alphaproteobacteria bacterium]